MTAPAVKRPVPRPGGKGPVATETPVKKAAKPAPAQEAAPEKASKGPSAAGLSCLCGCGQPTKTDKAKFIPGHDARLKSLLLKVERGEDGKKKSDVPEIAKKFLQKSKMSGHYSFPTESGNTPDEDKHGKPYSEVKEELEAEKKAKKDAQLKKLQAKKAAKPTKKAAKQEEDEEEEDEEELEEEEE